MKFFFSISFFQDHFFQDLSHFKLLGPLTFPWGLYLCSWAYAESLQQGESTWSLVIKDDSNKASRSKWHEICIFTKISNWMVHELCILFIPTVMSLQVLSPSSPNLLRDQECSAVWDLWSCLQPICLRPPHYWFTMLAPNKPVGSWRS